MRSSPYARPGLPSNTIPNPEKPPKPRPAEGFSKTSRACNKANIDKQLTKQQERSRVIHGKPIPATKNMPTAVQKNRPILTAIPMPRRVPYWSCCRNSLLYYSLSYCSDKKKQLEGCEALPVTSMMFWHSSTQSSQLHSQQLSSPLQQAPHSAS